jgi:hypothetical protein
MSMRLTTTKVDRWIADVERAEQILARVSAEVVRYRGAAKGGRLSHLQECRMAVEIAKREAREAQVPLEALARSERRGKEMRSVVGS